MGRSGGRKMFALIAHFIQHGLRAEEASFEPDAEPVHPRQERAWRLWRKGRLLPQRRHQDHQLFPSPVLIDLSLEGPRMSVASGSGHGSVSPAPSYDLSIAGL